MTGNTADPGQPWPGSPYFGSSKGRFGRFASAAHSLAAPRAGPTFQTLKTRRNLPNRLLELPWSCQTMGCGKPSPYLLARNCQMLPSNLPNAPNFRNLPKMGCGKPSLPFFLLARNNLPNAQNPPKPSGLGAAKSLGCGKLSLSLSIPAGCFKPSQNSEPSETCQTGSWSLSFSTGPKLADAPYKPALGAAKLWAVASRVFPFVLARNCRMLPSNLPNLSKLAEPALAAAKVWAVASQFLFYSPETTGRSLQTLQTLQTSETCQTGSWSCQTMGCGKQSLSTGLKLPDAPFKPSKRSKTSETCQAGSWSCQTQPFMRIQFF